MDHKAGRIIIADKYFTALCYANLHKISNWEFMGEPYKLRHKRDCDIILHPSWIKNIHYEQLNKILQEIAH